MKKALFGAILGLLALSGGSFADTTTPNLGLTLPTLSPYDVWGAKLNNNFSIIDSSVTKQPNVIAYGAKCDGVTNDLTAIQTAINSVSSGSILYFPPGNCVVIGTIDLVPNMFLQGTNVPSQPAGTGTTITELTNTANVFLFPSTGSGLEADNIHLDGFLINGGSYTFSAPNGYDAVFISNVQTGPTVGSFLLNGFGGSMIVRDSQFYCGSVGCVVSKAAGTNSIYSFEENTFDHVLFFGGINCVDLEEPASNAVTSIGNSFINVDCNSTSGDGMKFAGGFARTLFTRLGTEGVGYPNSYTGISYSTCTTTAGSATVLVSSPNYIANGSTVTIAGAGTSGVDWYPYVISGGYTTSMTMSATAPTSVSGSSSEITNSLYSDVVFVSSNGVSPNGAIFIQPAIGAGHERYAIDGTAGSNIVVLEPTLGRPSYDPNWQITHIGDSGDFIDRQPNSFAGDLFADPLIGGLGRGRTEIPSPAGMPTVFGLVGSNIFSANGSYGDFEFRKIASGNPLLFDIGSSAVVPDSQALCLLGTTLGHCTSVVGAGGACTCVTP